MRVLLVGAKAHLFHHFPLSLVELREERIGLFGSVFNLGKAQNIGNGHRVLV